jgi:hypothetical protein
MVAIGSVIGLRNAHIDCQVSNNAGAWLGVGFLIALVALPGTLYALVGRLVRLRLGLIGLALALVPIGLAIWIWNLPDHLQWGGCDAS